MKNNYQRLIEFLLENAGVSIKYRVKKEILNVSVESDEMQALQAEILEYEIIEQGLERLTTDSGKKLELQGYILKAK